MMILHHYLKSTLLFSILLFVFQGTSQISFEENSLEQGVLHYFNGASIGGGICVYDFNQDGLDDLTLSTYAGSFIGFYVNTGNGFQLIPPLVRNVETVKQINWVDYDNDGDPDLYVAANDGINRLYENTGALEMEDVTQESGLPLNTHFGYGACWGDYNRDGWVDLYYASKGIIGDPDAIRSYNRLFKNNSDGTFSERTFEAVVSDEGKLPFCAAFLDYNNDMWPDIYIANDKLTFNTLLENTGHGSFEDVSVETGANARMNAMCVNPGDYDQDGWMDIYVTNTPVGSQYLRNTGVANEQGFIQLENVAQELGIAFEGGNCWGSNFLDGDNDGDLDLYVSSSISSPKEFSSAFFENEDKKSFGSPLIAGFQKDTSESYTNAIGDFNNDGKIDIIVQNNDPTHFFLWMNTTDNENNWLKIKLEGILSNRDGIGVKLEAFSNGLYQLQYTLCGSGFLGQNSSYKHFGLGQSDKLDSLKITWPTGHVDKLFDLKSDQIHYITEGQSTNGVIDIDDNISIVERSLSTPTLEVEQQSSVKIFPNPAFDLLKIESEDRITKLEIYNANGTRHTRVMKSDTIHILDTSALSSGIYILKVYFESRSIAIKRFVKL